MIHFIDRLEAQMILEPGKDGKYHGPRPDMEFDQFIVFEDPNWVAIDNTTGNAWTENFTSVNEALAWLGGKERDDGEPEQHAPIGKLADPVEDEPTALANSGAAEKDDCGDHEDPAYALKREFETAFDDDRLLHLHESDVELTELITSFYEKETGKSCVYWYCPRFKDFDGDQFRDSLPRQNDYETNGYSGNFWKWMGEIEDKAIESGVETVDEMAAFFLGYLWPEAVARRTARDRAEADEDVPEPQTPHELTLGELLAIVVDHVEIISERTGGLRWFMYASSGKDAVASLSGAGESALLDKKVKSVSATDPVVGFHNGSAYAADSSKVTIKV